MTKMSDKCLSKSFHSLLSNSLSLPSISPLHNLALQSKPGTSRPSHLQPLGMLPNHKSPQCSQKTGKLHIWSCKPTTKMTQSSWCNLGLELPLEFSKMNPIYGTSHLIMSNPCKMHWIFNIQVLQDSRILLWLSEVESLSLKFFLSHSSKQLQLLEARSFPHSVWKST